MKNKAFVVLILGVLLVAAGGIVGHYGTLLGNMLSSGGGIVIGGAFFCMVIKDLHTEKKKKANRIAMIIVALAIAFIAGKNFVASAMDMSTKPAKVTLYDCDVYYRSGRKLMLRNYYITGHDEVGQSYDFLINRDIYDKYNYEGNLSFTVIFWEKSRIIKELVEE